MGACTQPTIPVSAVSARKMGLLTKASAERKPIDRNAMAIIRKKIHFLCAVYGFLETQEDFEKGPEKLA